MSNILNKILNLIKNKKLNDAEKLCSKLIKKNKDNYKLYNLYNLVNKPSTLCKVLYLWITLCMKCG